MFLKMNSICKNILKNTVYMDCFSLITRKAWRNIPRLGTPREIPAGYSAGRVKP